MAGSTGTAYRAKALPAAASRGRSDFSCPRRLFSQPAASPPSPGLLAGGCGAAEVRSQVAFLSGCGAASGRKKGNALKNLGTRCFKSIFHILVGAQKLASGQDRLVVA